MQRDTITHIPWSFMVVGSLMLECTRAVINLLYCCRHTDSATDRENCGHGIKGCCSLMQS